MAEGQYAPRTFKSLISQQLVPTICAECDISMQDWEHISDRVLRLFAEAFLQRLAEAAECGCTLTDTAVKSTFTRAVKQEPARRIVERLRQTGQQQLPHRANLKQATNVPGTGAKPISLLFMHLHP